MTTHPPPRPRIPAGTVLLALGQALNLTVAVLMVTVAALAGGQLASDASWATVPYGVQFATVLACSYPVSALMRRVGRRSVFLGSSALLVLAGGVGLMALETRSFPALVVAHALVGAYVACANYFRFAAVDGLDERLRAQALSWVVGGGVLAALAGPLLAQSVRQITGFAEFAWVYGALMGLGLVQLALLAFWTPPVPGTRSKPEFAARSTGARVPLEDHLRIGLAIAVAAGGYLVMNLLMVQTSLILKDICSFEMSAHAIQIHVLAMFAPSFLTGWLIARLGLRLVLCAGLSLLAAAAAVGAFIATDYGTAVAGLLLLGLGWNLSYVGGSTLLAQAVPEHVRHRWQGLHESATAACATAGAFLPAPLLTGIGWAGTNGLALGLCVAGLLATQRILAPQQQRQQQHA